MRSAKQFLGDRCFPSFDLLSESLQRSSALADTDPSWQSVLSLSGRSHDANFNKTSEKSNTHRSQHPL
ncbi:hypothetical protein CKA32_003385 [Geitlerinema sp. FC II]|nr:hypothetical protein CKA32_003385 [Geitlerinema sp. FC II]